MNKIDLIDQIDNWLDHIQDKKLAKVVEPHQIEGEVITFTPYHYLKREGSKLFLNVPGSQVYRLISSISHFNIGLSNQIKNLQEHSMHMNLLKSKNAYRLVTLKKKSTKSNLLIDEQMTFDAIFGQTFQKVKPKQEIKKHINDVWNCDNSKPMFTSIELDKFQNKAVSTSLKQNISFIVGHAGTGKSFTALEIWKILKNSGWKVSRIAPTGRAAQIISGKTIHSWLEPIIEEYSGGKVKIIGFKKETFSPKECLIIDESSMIDDNIWSEIMRVWNASDHIHEKKMVFIGDTGQLEPVGEGQPFIDHINANPHLVTHLEQIHRNHKDSGIIKMASYTRKTGFVDIYNQYNNVKVITNQEALSMIASDQSIQMVTPMRNGAQGSLAINKQIKSMMQVSGNPDFHTLYWNPETKKYESHTPIHVNDKVIITKNLWKWNVTNGTIGIFLGIEKAKIYNHITGKYNSRESLLFSNPTTGRNFYLPNNASTRAAIELGYVITIHKAQGSEFETTLLYLPNLWRNSKMLYTAITRAKKQLYVSIP